MLTHFLQTFVFCDSKLGISGRQVRSHGAQVSKDNTVPKTFSLNSGSTRRPGTPTLPLYTTEERRKSRFGFKFPIRHSLQSPAMQISRPEMIDPEQFAKWDERSSPVAPDVQRPPTALHPAYARGPAAPPSSRYSEVSNMDRF